MKDYQIRRVVLGLDRDGLASHALTRAMDIAASCDAKLDVVHAVDIHPPLRGSSSGPEWAATTAAAMAEAHRALEGKLELSVETPPFAELPVSDYLTVRVGKPSEVLLCFAEEHSADLIVLGPHKHRKLFDFGGTARAVVARSPCPLWVETQEPKPIKRILAAVDLSEESEKVLALARTMAGVFDAPVKVLHSFFEPSFAYDFEGHEPTGPTYVIEHVRRSTEEALDELVSGFAWGGVEAETEFTSGEAFREILDRQGQADLIVMGSHGRSAIGSAVLGSQAYKVLRSAEIPVALVHQSAHPLLGA
ncbi:MAG TPA: universal stress protein [Planctomycetes bacterium]|nr:universal stress protein [Planctomycetota bacterium]